MLFCGPTWILARQRRCDRAVASVLRLFAVNERSVMSTFSRKTRNPSRKAALGLLIPCAVAAASLPASADSWTDYLNPLNLFKGEKYETKIVPDVPADDLYNQALARLQSKDYDGAAKKFA